MKNKIRIKSSQCKRLPKVYLRFRAIVFENKTFWPLNLFVYCLTMSLAIKIIISDLAVSISS